MRTEVLEVRATVSMRLLTSFRALAARFSSERPVRSTTGTSGQALCTALKVSRPAESGSMRSRSTRSNFLEERWLIASFRVTAGSRANLPFIAESLSISHRRRESAGLSSTSNILRNGIISMLFRRKLHAGKTEVLHSLHYLYELDKVHR